MASVVLQHWVSDFAMPPAGCAISLLTWLAVVRRGWLGVLPLLSLYVIFWCLTSVVLLPLYYLQL